MYFLNQRISIVLFILFTLSIFNCASPEKDFEDATQQNTEQAYRDFIKSHTDHPLAEGARKKLEILVFETAMDGNNIEALENFLAEFPDGAKAPEAQQQLEILSLKFTRDIGTIKAYEKFIAKFPDSKLIDSASVELEEIIFDSIKTINTISAYDEYLKLYPEGQFSKIAREKRQIKIKLAKDIAEAKELGLENLIYDLDSNFNPTRERAVGLLAALGGTKALEALINRIIEWSDRLNEVKEREPANLMEAMEPIVLVKLLSTTIELLEDPRHKKDLDYISKNRTGRVSEMASSFLKEKDNNVSQK